MDKVQIRTEPKTIPFSCEKLNEATNKKQIALPIVVEILSEKKIENTGKRVSFGYDVIDCQHKLLCNILPLGETKFDETSIKACLAWQDHRK